MKKHKKRVIETEKDTKEGLRRRLQGVTEELEGVAANLATEKASVKELLQEITQLKDVASTLSRDLERAVGLSTQGSSDLAAAQKALADYQQATEQKIEKDAIVKRAEIGAYERALEIAVTAGRNGDGGHHRTMVVAGEGLPGALERLFEYCATPAGKKGK